MNAGLEVRNTGNHILIDSTYKNLALVSTHTLTAKYGTASPQLTITGKNPVIAIGNTNGAYVGLWYSQRSGNTFSYRFASSYDDSGTPFTVYVFDEPDSVAAGSGLTVWNESGEVVFNSEMKYLKPLGMFSSAGASAPYEWTYSNSYSVNIAIAVCKANILKAYLPNGNSHILIGSVRVSGSSVDARISQVYSSFGGYERKNGHSLFMVINALHL